MCVADEKGLDNSIIVGCFTCAFWIEAGIHMFGVLHWCGLGRWDNWSECFVARVHQQSKSLVSKTV